MRVGVLSDGRRKAEWTAGCFGVGFSLVNELMLLTQGPCVTLVPGEEAGQLPHPHQYTNISIA